MTLFREKDADYIQAVFGKDGYLSKQFDGYEPRPSQIAMASAIDAAIRGGHHLIAEGPTGVGKSLAYSAPAAFHASHNEKRICIVTANNNLQRQVYDKDLRLLSNAVPWGFTYALRKGLGKYLCARDFDEQKWRELDQLNLTDSKILKDTVKWAEGTETGDFEESPGPSRRVWRSFSTTGEECDGRRCAYSDECFAMKAKNKANSSNIVITNYHLLFIHLRLGLESKILPPFDVIILDEAHRAAKIARDFFGTEITFGNLYRCTTIMHMVKIRGFGSRGKKLRDSIIGEIHALWAELSKRARARDAILHNGWALNSGKLEELLDNGKRFYEDAARALGVTRDDLAKPDMKVTQKTAEGANYLKLAERCDERRLDLFDFRVGNTKGMVYFVEGSGDEAKGHSVSLRSKAVEVAGALHHSLFKRFPTVIQTSATLAIKGGGKGEFDYVRREMGMNGIENIAETSVSSPFDWAKQGLLVIPKSMPEYRYGDVEEKWESAVCDHFEQIIDQVEGRTMGLFTSFRMMERVRDRLRSKGKHRIFVQGEATNRELAESFHSDVSSVLLGTESFAEGISIEGEACTCVILDKIPFTSKNDPIMFGIEKKLKEEGAPSTSAFHPYALPEAIISFKQRVGRLIRTVNDVGVVVVLDKRLHSKGYRRQFTGSVPFGRVHDSIDVIKPFLQRVGAL